MKDGRGYFEDRRPAANADPYQIAAIMLETVCSSSSKKCEFKLLINDVYWSEGDNFSVTVGKKSIVVPVF